MENDHIIVVLPGGSCGTTQWLFIEASFYSCLLYIPPNQWWAQ